VTKTHPANPVSSFLRACRELGATITSEPSDGGFLTTCSYGTPWFASDGTPWGGPCAGPNARVNRGAFTKHRVDLRDAATFGKSYAGMNLDRLDGVTVYEWPELLANRGTGGRGVVFAIGFRRAFGKDDDRRCCHLYIDADGKVCRGVFG